MGIIEGYPRSTTAVALGDMTELNVISKTDFEDYCKRNPEKTILIMKNMSARIRDLTHDNLEACHTIAESIEAEQNGENAILKTQIPIRMFQNISLCAENEVFCKVVSVEKQGLLLRFTAGHTDLCARAIETASV